MQWGQTSVEIRIIGGVVPGVAGVRQIVRNFRLNGAFSRLLLDVQRGPACCRVRHYRRGALLAELQQARVAAGAEHLFVFNLHPIVLHRNAILNGTCLCSDRCTQDAVRGQRHSRMVEGHAEFAIGRI